MSVKMVNLTIDKCLQNQVFAIFVFMALGKDMLLRPADNGYLTSG